MSPQPILKHQPGRAPVKDRALDIQAFKGGMEFKSECRLSLKGFGKLKTFQRMWCPAGSKDSIFTPPWHHHKTFSLKALAASSLTSSSSFSAAACVGERAAELAVQQALEVVSNEFTLRLKMKPVNLVRPPPEQWPLQHMGPLLAAAAPPAKPQLETNLSHLAVQRLCIELCGVHLSGV